MSNKLLDIENCTILRGEKALKVGYGKGKAILFSDLNNQVLEWFPEKLTDREIIAIIDRYNHAYSQGLTEGEVRANGLI